jgi:hypothetical protein
MNDTTLNKYLGTSGAIMPAIDCSKGGGIAVVIDLDPFDGEIDNRRVEDIAVTRAENPDAAVGRSVMPLACRD